MPAYRYDGDTDPDAVLWPCHIDPSTGFIYRDRDPFVAPQPDGSHICSHRHSDGTRHQWTTHNHPGSVGAAP